MDLAIRQARRSDCRHKVGAVLVAGNRVLAASPNLPRNSPVIDFRNASFHAEEAVLRRARNAAGATAYVARVNSSGIPLLSRPCRRCQDALKAAGILRVYFTVCRASLGILNLSDAPAGVLHTPAAGRPCLR
ncbi:hypothetical protein [Streptomyces chryseus]